MEWLTKDEQVAEALRDLIQSGEWSGQLPGHRRLMQRLKVHRVVIERALDRLVAEGMVEPAQQGKRRGILKAGSGGQGKDGNQTLLIVGPHGLNDYSHTNHTILTSVFQSAEAEGMKVSYEFTDFGYPGKAVTQVKRLLADHAPTRLILMSPSVSLVNWAVSGSTVPWFAIGGDVRAVPDPIDGLGVSFSKLVCDACALFRANGHRRILIPMISGRTVLRKAAMDASTKSWAADIPRVELDAMFANQGEERPDVLARFWPHAFARLKPTAVIAMQNKDYLSLLSYCYQKGIRIPEELSVILLSNDSDCAWLNPQPDCFEFPVKKICRKVMRWLLKPAAKPQGFEFVSSTYLPGGTLAKARAR